MESFIAANRALLQGIESALKGELSVSSHYCSGHDCAIHRAALVEPLRQALGDNTRLGDFISEVLGKAQCV
jgi:hypothetical protein